MKLYKIFLALIIIMPFTQAERPNTIPALQEWTDGNGNYTFSGEGEIVVNNADFEILKNSAVTFAEDIFLLTKEEGAACTLSVRGAANCNAGDIFLTIDSTDTSIGPRGYILEISDFITIKALSDLGVFWGTRSVLQLLRQGYTIDRGTARDWPVFKERGLMVDFGRKWFPASWIYKHIRDLAYIKNNIYHLHLSDNLGFRLPSTKHPEITSPAFYTLSQIDSINELAEKYHVTIIPEIDMPGHMDYALINHPEIAISSEVRPYISLHIGKDSAYVFAKEILEEFIPLFPGPYWHVGADEYPEDVYSKDTLFRHYAKKTYGTNAIPQDCYYGFVNWANEIVRSHGKIMRAWKDGMVSTNAVKIDTNIIVEHWYKAYGPPAQTMLDKGHWLINCHYTRLYHVLGGWNLNDRDLYENFEPYMLQGDDPVSDAHHPGLLGAKIHVWCDDSGAQSTETIENNILNGLRAVAQKTWESPKLVTSFNNFTPIIEDIGRAPGFTNDLPDIPAIEVIDPVNNNYKMPLKPVKTKQCVLDISKSSIHMQYNGRHTIEVLTLQGKCVTLFSGIGKSKYNISENIAPGIYLLKVITDKERTIKLPVFSK
jgi:hexosaminidase